MCHIHFILLNVSFVFFRLIITGQPYEHVLQSEHDTSLYSRTGSLIDLKRYFGYKRYLEIGLMDLLFLSHLLPALKYICNLVRCSTGCNTNENFAWLADEFERGEALCVDPGMGGTHRMTSDEFFRQYQGPPFDLIFIDGLHLSEQVLTDIKNALQWLSPGQVLKCVGYYHFSHHYSQVVLNTKCRRWHNRDARL